MLLLPADMRRRGIRTTEFWVCAAAEAALLAGSLLWGSGGMGIGAAAVAVGYCACRTALKVMAAGGRTANPTGKTEG